jgi:hypothetical protein
MKDLHGFDDTPKAIPGWACIAIGVCFVLGLVGLIIVVRIIGGS